MTVSVALVAVSQLDTMWPIVKPLLEPAVERSNGALTMAALAGEMLEERMQLWVVADLTGTTPQLLAIAVTDVGRDLSGRRTCDIRIVTGFDRKRWLDCRRHIEAWARDEMGCTWIRMTARKGYMRELPDYRMTHVILEKDLTADVEREKDDRDDVANEQPDLAGDALRASPGGGGQGSG